MEKEMRKSATIDEAFKAIKTETGISDVQEMVKKFFIESKLTRCYFQMFRKVRLKSTF